MPSEITAFIQPHTQTRTTQNANINSDKDTSMPGLFDAFISEYISPSGSEEIITDITQSEFQSLTPAPEDTQLIAFTDSRSFSQSVIDILAGLNENADLKQEIPAKIEDKIEDIIDTLKDSGEKIHEDLQSIIVKVKAVVSEKISAVKSELPDDINGIVSQILNDESIPEETRNEIVNVIDALVNELKDSDFAGENVKNFALKLSDMIYGHGRTEKVFASVDGHDSNNTADTADIEDKEDKEEDEDDNDDNDDVSVKDYVNAEVKDTHVNIPGYVVIQNADLRPADSVSEPKLESQPELTQTNQSLQSSQSSQNITPGHAENQQAKQTSQKTDVKIQTESKSKFESKSENVKHESNHESNFDSHLEISENENRTSNENQNQKNQNQNQTQNQTQNQNQGNNPSGHEENSSEHEQSRNNTSGTRITSRNDTRRGSANTSRTDDDRTDTNSRRTESRNNFQSFFEGVLSSRRNASRTSPLPLNLNSASYNFSQSSTLRTGLVNVVRFIRADGVQKANVVIDPPALGRISVELTSNSSGVEASIKVASEQIRQLIQDQLSELRMNLSQQGVQVTEFTVDVRQDNSNGNHQNHNDDGNLYRTFALNESDDDITEEFRVDLEEGLLYWVA